jgi:predicted DsbA family dithiol-disulfide isomerase
MLLEHQGDLRAADVCDYAKEMGLDADRITTELRRREHAARVSEDVASADESGVSGTPTFFINGRRHYGTYDIGHLKAAVRAARNRAVLTVKA